MKVKLFIAVGCLLLSTALYAMTAFEFIKLENSTERRKLLEPIIFSFVSRGFKNVPDWATLGIRIRELVLKNGYSYQSLETVAEEAAKAEGMTR